ncbi:hypothetical protein AMAG_17727 [Allomyces macrogynus ATCC 38327]|uniref:Uncharacterized protein n=1 Tax=Allomyces macrogynus (strain ATCC 38327) TaxID=578462 RepID=A0A0L0RYB3_ALLM3|nr:hypothetical protein AMAG_17727 [Allomyces macrogynus ATCC 38327]|eukprot:KNE55031.1 hypothetical protein AMAG_17727 [Allomyces macrogynus ATCC 38327]
MKYPTLLLATAAAALAVVATTVDAQQIVGNVPSTTTSGTANAPHLTVAHAAKPKRKRATKKAKGGIKAWTAEMQAALKKRSGARVNTKVKGGKPIKKSGSKLSAAARKARNARHAKKVKALKQKMSKLPVGHPDRKKLALKLKKLRLKAKKANKKPKTKTAALMSTAAAPGAHKTHLHSSPAGLVPFVDPPFPAAIQHGADGSVRLVRKGLTAGHGVIHKYGFQTAKPLAIPAGTKYVTFLAKIKAQAKKPAQRKPMKMVGKAPPRPGSKAPVCHKSDTAITVFHGGKPLGGLRFPKGSHGSNKYETLRLRVPVSRLSASSAPITLQAAHDHASTTKCMDHSILQLKGFKVQFHDTLPVRKPKTAAAGAKAKFSVSESGYDYASFDDSWDETYDDMWEDNYDDGDFSVSEDAAYEGDDMWEDNYDEGFSVSEDAAYDGDDMWEDNYDDEGFSLEDSYDEDAAADDEYDGGDFSLEDSYDEDAAADDEYDGGDYSVEDSYDEDAVDDEYDGGDYSVEDSYDEDAVDDEYDGSDFSVAEDAWEWPSWWPLK